MTFRLLLVFFLWTNFLFAQEDIQFKYLTNENGLSQNSVYDVVQDSVGFIWIGTTDGLNKYDGNKFRVYRHDRSDSTTLSNSSVRSLHVDKKGDLWIGTRNGLNRLNKKKDNFERFPLPDGNHVGAINLIYEDQEGYLWLATWDSGLHRFDKKTKTYLSFQYNPNNPKGLPSNWISWTAQDLYEKDYMWVSLANEGGFGRLNKKTGHFQNWKHQSENPNSLPHNNVGAFLPNPDGSFWITTNGGGLSHFNPHTNTFKNYQHQPQNPYSLVSNNVETIFKDSKGRIWIGGSEGLSLMKQSMDSIYFINYKHSPQNPKSLSNNYVFRLYEDPSGIIWISTYNGGVSYFDAYKKAFRLYEFNATNPQGLPFNNTRSILEAHNGNLWVGLSEVALCWATPKMREKNTFRKYFYSPDSVLKSTAYCMVEDHEKVIWIGTWSHGVVKLKENALGNDFQHKFEPTFSNPDDSIKIDTEKVRYIFEDSQKNIWACGLHFGLWKFNRQKNYFERFFWNNKPVTNIRCITEDNNGIIWIGMEKGLMRLDLKKQSQKIYTTTQDPNSLANDRIHFLHFDKRGILWIATSGGLNLLDPDKELFSSLTDDEGFGNKSVYGILEDEFDNLWLTTNSGLYKFSKNEMIFEHFDVTDGIHNNEFNINTYHKSRRTGELFCGGIGGFNSFFSQDIKKNQFQAKIIITDFKVLGKSVLEYGENSPLKAPIWHTQEIELSYQDYMFSFDFASMHFSKKNKAIFRYKLEGFSEDWIQVGADRAFAIFTNIPHGRYIFRVQGTNADGLWSNYESSVRLIIKPPFWKTWWFMFLVAGSIIFGALSWYRYRMKIVKQQKLHLEQQVLERTAQVVQQKEEIENQNRDIRASINYAQSIQKASLPTDAKFAEALPQSFVLFRPRDIVSGDFYWLHQEQNHIIVAAVDCTGHGVPGAFMSMIGSNFLHEIIKVRRVFEPKTILEMLHKGIQQTLNQQQTNNRDGMDLAICSLSKGKLLFGGAKNGLVLIQDKKMQFIKGSKYNVGGYQNEADIIFEQHSFDIHENTFCYIFSDGYQDQFGGGHEKKFMSKRFRELLFEIHQNDFEQQKQILNQKFEEWKGNLPQIDDVLVIGFKIPKDF